MAGHVASVHRAGGINAVGAFVCEDCGKTFDSVRALGGHRSAKHSAAATPGEYPCDVCGNVLTTQRTLALHRRNSHPDAAPLANSDTKTKTKTKTKTTQPPALRELTVETDALLDEMRTKLQREQDKLDAYIAQLAVEASAAREARTRVAAMLRAVTPKSQTVSRGASTRGYQDFLQQQRDAKAAALLAFVETHAAQLADGFTSNMVAEMTASEGVEPKMSSKVIRELLDQELRNAGVVRADKVVKGGGMQFKLVASLNGSEGGAHDGEA